MTHTDVLSLDVGDEIKHAHPKHRFQRDWKHTITKIDTHGIETVDSTILARHFIPFRDLRNQYERIEKKIEVRR